MSDYKTMYFHLFNRVSDVIQALTLAQQETEELYISAEKPAIKVLEKYNGNSEVKPR